MTCPITRKGPQAPWEPVGAVDLRPCLRCQPLQGTATPMIQVTPKRSVSFPYSGVNTDGPGSRSTVAPRSASFRTWGPRQRRVYPSGIDLSSRTLQRGFASGSRGLPVHTRGRRPPGRSAPTLEKAMTTVRKKAYVVLDGTVLPIDRITADRPYYSGKKKHHGMNVQVLVGSSRPSDLGLGRTTRSRARSDRGPDPWHPRRSRRRRDQVLGGQGVPGRGPCCPRPVPRQESARLAPASQPRSRQDSQPRRTRHGQPYMLAAPAGASLRHHPDHRRRPGRRRARTHHLIKMEKAPSIRASRRSTAIPITGPLLCA